MTRFETLLEGFRRDEMADADLQEFLDLLQADAGPMADSILQDLHQNKFAGLTDTAQRKRMLDRILEQNRQERKTLVRLLSLKTPVRLLFRRMAAASVILLVSAGFFLWHQFHGKEPAAGPPQVLSKDVAPGGNRAILTLSGGQKIVLDSAANGILAQQGNMQIQKISGGQLAYERSNEKPSEVLYNTLSTPRGGQYQLTLPDGTKVWLNAASSITYPTAFSGGSREVTVTGEAYFEVFKNVSQPFQVKMAAQTVQVLGTHFNVNTYIDEPVSKTTLLEGSVRVSGPAGTSGPGRESVILQPGEQAQVRTADHLGDSAIEVVRGVNLDAVVAWKNGLFDFTNASLPVVMKQLERWYDIEVQYPHSIPVYKFQGQLPRDLILSQVLLALGESEVKFKIAGRILIIEQNSH